MREGGREKTLHPSAERIFRRGNVQFISVCFGFVCFWGAWRRGEERRLEERGGEGRGGGEGQGGTNQNKGVCEYARVGRVGVALRCVELYI